MPSLAFHCALRLHVYIVIAATMLGSKLINGAVLAKVLAASHRQYTEAQTVLERPIPSATVNDVTVQLFGWNWTFVASECRDYLGPMGYGYVQVSPPQETIQGPQWWTDYQPVSYNLTGKRGNRDDFKSMIQTCKDAGVGVIVDAVMNHMAANSGKGTAGTIYDKYSYPTGFNYSTFHHCNNGHRDMIQDYTNATEVQQCELVGLSDHNTELPFVQNVLSTYLKDLVSLGASGLRVDAAKHMAASSLQKILAPVSSQVYIVQEVIYGADEPIKPDQYKDLGNVFMFQGSRDLKRMFLSDDIRYLLDPIPWGSGWGGGYLSSNVAATFVANHDTERDGTTLRWDSPNNAYVLANIFLLGWDYGTPTVFSGWDYKNFDDGAPEQRCDEHGGGFRCEHRWQAINNMVRFHNQVWDSSVDKTFKGGWNQVGFTRGTAGVLLINNSGNSWSGTWTTGLAAGRYCDIIHDTDTSPKRCNGDFYNVDSQGTFSGTVKPYDAIALYVGAQ